MNRRHIASLALAASGTLAISTVATAGALSPSVAVATPPSSPANVAASVAFSNLMSAEIGTTPNPIVASASARVLQKTRAKNVKALKDIATAIEVANAFQAAEAAKQAKEATQARFAALVTAQRAVQTPMWACIRTAESGTNYSLVSGAYGILLSTWSAYSNIWSPYGSWSTPGQAPTAVQDLVAYSLYQIGGGFGGWNDYCTGR
ncbi:MAG: hypothetical protein WCI12_06910 [Actinomycetes bacterium]